MNSYVLKAQALVEDARVPEVFRGLGCRLDITVVPRIYNTLLCRKPFELARDVEVNSLVLGAYSYISQGSAIWNSQIGNYVSIARDCLIGMVGHPIDWVTQSPVGYMNFFYEHAPSFKPQEKFDFFPKRIVIEDSVWIGARVIITGAKAITVGRGSIVAAGSVVTRDVPPYSIVAGNPAKVIRMRFSESIAMKLEESHWWLYDINTLQKNGLTLNLSKVSDCLDVLKSQPSELLTRCEIEDSWVKASRSEGKILIQTLEKMAS